jgi:hypothetical protein
MANVRKRISELTALTSASLDTTIVGVDGGTTYKIELDTLADAVTSRVNILDRSRLSALESVTSSFETKGRSVISSSAQITSLGFSSSSVDLTSLNSFTSSQEARNTAFTTGINARLQTSSFNEFSASVHSEILAATNEQDLSAYVTTLVVNTLSGSVDVRLDNLELNSGSYLTSINGAISSSEQVLGNSGVYSSSAQIQGNIYSAGSSFTFQDLLIGAGTTSGKITTDGSKYISVMPTYNVESARFWSNGNVTIQDAGDYVDNGFKLEVSGSTRIVGSFVATDGITGSTNFNTIVNKPTLISGSSQLTSSFDTRYTLSSSVTQTTWDNISGKPNGIVSQSTDLSSLNSYTQSLQNAIELTGSTVSFLGNIIVYGTQSVINSQNVEISDNILYLSPTASTDNDLGIVGHYNDGTYRHAGIFMDASDGHSWKAFNGLQTETTATVDTSGTGFTLADFKAGAFTGTSFSGQINSTNGVISGSEQITSLGFVSGSYLTSLSGAISSSSQLTSSYDSRYTLSGSVSAVPSGTISGSSQITGIVNLTNLSATSQISASVFVGGFGVAEAKYTVISAKPMTFYPNPSIESVRFTTAGAVLIGGNHSENGFKLSVTGSARIIGSTSITGSLVVSDGITGSIAATNGVISGSSQLTASYDTRYALSGSGGTIPGGTISGSSQITTLGFATTSSLNTLTASFNSFTASAQSVTTGSNSFNGTQTITGSLIITTGSFIGSQILANTSSLYLTSGSNMYVQNNGIVEITGSLIVSGSTMFATAGGDEGGEIQFGIPTTNTTLQNRVTVDLWRNRLRIFEGSAGANGVYIDLSKPTGNNNEITYKASGLVNAGDFVQLDNIKATITTTGNRGLSLATISGTFACNIAGNYAGAVVGASGSSGTATITTSASTSLFGWGFTTQGDIATYIITDTTNSRAYRITIQIGNAFNNNLVSIERLH